MRSTKLEPTDESSTGNGKFVHKHRVNFDTTKILQCGLWVTKGLLYKLHNFARTRSLQFEYLIHVRKPIFLKDLYF